MTDHLLSEAVREYAREIERRIDYHLLGAWRAGYRFVDVIHVPPDVRSFADDRPEGYFDPGVRIVVHNDPDLPVPMDGATTRYDMASVDEDTIRRAARQR